MPLVRVENVDHNVDGSTTVYGRDVDTDAPVVHTYPAGAMVERVVVQR